MKLNRHALLQAHCTDPTYRHNDRVHDQTKTFTTWSYETDHPLSLEALRQTVRKLPVTIYRDKAVIYSSDAPTRRAVLQVIGKRVGFCIDDEWDGRVPRTEIVVIGADGGIGGALLRDQFRRVLVAREKRSKTNLGMPVEIRRGLPD